jgi:hypothetical protein
MNPPAEPNTRPPLPVEQLLTADERRLRIALGTGEPRPWPVTLEENIAETARRIEAQAAQPAPNNCGGCRAKLNLEPEADPRLDHLPAYRSGSDANRLLAILDELTETERGEG